MEYILAFDLTNNRLCFLDQEAQHKLWYLNGHHWPECFGRYELPDDVMPPDFRFGQLSQADAWARSVGHWLGDD